MRFSGQNIVFIIVCLSPLSYLLTTHVPGFPKTRPSTSAHPAAMKMQSADGLTPFRGTRQILAHEIFRCTAGNWWTFLRWSEPELSVEHPETYAILREFAALFNGN